MAACGPDTDVESAGREPAAVVGSACTISERSRTPVTLPGGTQVYVEPHGLALLDSGFLLAGQPAFEWTVDSSSPSTMAGAGGFLGVRIQADSTLRVPYPPGLDQQPDWVRLVSLGPTRWGGLLQEGTAPPASGRIVYAEYDGATWSAVEPLPLPQDGLLDLATGSSLLLDGLGRVVWAARVERPTGRVDVVMFRRAVGGWTSDVVARDWVDDPELHPRGSEGLWLAVAGLDPEHESRVASVRVRAVGAPGEPVTLMVGLPGERFQDPTFAGGGDRLSIAWRHVGAAGVVAPVWLQRDLGAAVELGEANAPPVLLDPGAVLLQALRAPDGSTLWVTHHVSAVTESETLRFTRDDGARLTLVAEVAYPWVGPFRAAIADSGDILVVGPQVDADPLFPSVRSLVLRLNLSCT